MSFDLGVLDFDTAPSQADVVDRYVRLCENEDDGLPASTGVDAFLAECIQRWPGETDENFESSPWASWPLETQRTAAGFVANITWPRAEDMKVEWIRMAERYGLVLYDPQADEFVLPSRLRADQESGRSWLRRRRPR